MDESWRAPMSRAFAVGLGCALGDPRRSPRGAVGEKLGVRVGSSLEFMDYRPYEPGDDLRRVDWPAFARTDRLMLRLYREEVTPHVDLLVDDSASMALAETTKATATLGAAALIAGAAESSRWSRRLYGISTQLQANARNIAGTEIRGGNAEPAGWDWPGFGRRAVRGHLGALTLRRRGLRVVVSDLLFAGDPESIVSRWADGAAGLWVVQVLAEADADPGAAGGFDGDVRLVDAEDGTLKEVRLDPSALRRYRGAFAAHMARWSEALTRVEARLVTLTAEPWVKTWDVAPLASSGLLRVV
ncbi:MAG: DUF58 domain-containing protein [Planctomycetota bacterium]